MLLELISSTVAGVALWQSIKEKAKRLVQKVWGALLALPDNILVETTVSWFDFADERTHYLDWTDDYWHMPRFPYGAVEDE
jgi:hypothetical protein